LIAKAKNVILKIERHRIRQEIIIRRHRLEEIDVEDEARIQGRCFRGLRLKILE
jgi:hypothetical protein